MKSKKNILSITITIVLCLVFVAYGLVLAYHTNIKRNASREVNTVTTENSLLSNSIGTTEKKSGLVLQDTAFSNVQPIINGNFNELRFTPMVFSANQFYDIQGCSNEKYVLNSECYIYIKFKYNGNINELNGQELEFRMNGYSINSCFTYDGQSCWNRFCKFSTDDGYHINNTKITNDPYYNNNDIDYYYSAVRCVLGMSGEQYISVFFQGQELISFPIYVIDLGSITGNDTDETSLHETVDFENSNFYSTYGIEQYKNGKSGYLFDEGGTGINGYHKLNGYRDAFSDPSSCYFENNLNAEYTYQKRTAPGSTIKISDSEGDDNLTNVQVGRYGGDPTILSRLSASMDLRSLLLYPEYDYSLENATYV